MKTMSELYLLSPVDTTAADSLPQPRVTLVDKVVTRLSELLGESLLQAKISALGILATDNEEDVEWVTAEELASSSGFHSTFTPSSTSTDRRPSWSHDPHDDIKAELLLHAKSLRRSPGSRKTLVKAAELYEEFLGDSAE
jgi:hypothetical protein